MDVTCDYCGAFHWLEERLKRSDTSTPEFSLCCHQGKVHLPRLEDPPDELHKLFTEQTTEARQFRENIRWYNAALAFTSFTAKEQNVNAGGGGPWVWKTGYTIYHRAGSLLGERGKAPTYSQLYFYDPAEALDYRMKHNTGVKPNTMQSLQNMLLRTNSYTRLFFHAYETLENTPSKELRITIIPNSSGDARRYNAPTVDEIAIVIPGMNDCAVHPRDIILRHRGGDLHFIHDHHPSYAPLHYVLLFPYGTPGWTYGLTHTDTNMSHTQSDGTNGAKNITQVRVHHIVKRLLLIPFTRFNFIPTVYTRE